jgi:hypothetical protein
MNKQNEQSWNPKTLGISTRTVWKWKRDHAGPTEDHWQTLAAFLTLDSTLLKN